MDKTQKDIDNAHPPLPSAVSSSHQQLSYGESHAEDQTERNDENFVADHAPETLSASLLTPTLPVTHLAEVQKDEHPELSDISPHCVEEPQTIADETDKLKTSSGNQPRTLRYRKLTSEATTSIKKRKRKVISPDVITSTSPTFISKPVESKGVAAGDQSSGEKRRVMPRRTGIEWRVGCKLQAMDFQKKWFPAKIVEVDEQDAEVLIHFDGWSSRFDEWVDMRSDRLKARAIVTKDTSSTSTSQKLPSQQTSDVAVGTVVLARWTKNMKAVKYPAIIKNILPRKKVNIQFYDGVEKETDLSLVQLIDPTLQKQALHIWDIMKEIVDESAKSTESSEKKPSRRQSLEAKRLQETKMEAAEALLSKLNDESTKPRASEKTSPTIESSQSSVSLTKHEPVEKTRPPSANENPPIKDTPCGKKKEKKGLQRKLSETVSSPTEAKVAKKEKRSQKSPVGSLDIKVSPPIKSSEGREISEAKASPKVMLFKSSDTENYGSASKPASLKKSDTKKYKHTLSNKKSPKTPDTRKYKGTANKSTAQETLDTKAPAGKKICSASSSSKDTRPTKQTAGSFDNKQPQRVYKRASSAASPPTSSVEPPTSAAHPPTLISDPSTENMRAEVSRKRKKSKDSMDKGLSTVKQAKKVTKEFLEQINEKSVSILLTRTDLTMSHTPIAASSESSESHHLTPSEKIAEGVQASSLIEEKSVETKTKIKKECGSSISTDSASEHGSAYCSLVNVDTKGSPVLSGDSNVSKSVKTEAGEHTFAGSSHTAALGSDTRQIVPESHEQRELDVVGTSDWAKGDANNDVEPSTLITTPIDTSSTNRSTHYSSVPNTAGTNQSVISTASTSQSVDTTADATANEDIKPVLDPDTFATKVDSSGIADVTLTPASSRRHSDLPMDILKSVAIVNLEKKVLSFPGNNESATNAGKTNIGKPPIASTSKSTGKRHSQSLDTKPKHGYGYTLVVESVDAKPAKAFIVEENHNRFQCSHCQKGFRKESLLVSHVKHYHKREGGGNATESQQASKRGRRKTISMCSSDSDVKTPGSTAPPTPLASPTPPKELLLPKKQPTKVATREYKRVNVEVDYEADTDEESLADSSYQTEVVNCKCGFNEEDGLMIQCEYCCGWQHAECFGIKPNGLPDRYICYICLDTPGVRESCKYLYNQDWIRHGSLPKLGSLDENTGKTETIVKRSHQELLKLQHTISSLGSMQFLLDSAAKGDTYELALWSSDEESPVGVNEQNARLTQQERLLLHIGKSQNNMEHELDDIDAKISELEKEADISSVKPGDDLVSTSRNLQMLLDDLKKVTKWSSLLAEKTGTDIKSEVLNTIELE